MVDSVLNVRGNSGYASGGNLSKAMGAANTTGSYFIAYVGVNDADQNCLQVPGVTELNFNGWGLGLGAGVVQANGVSSVNYNTSKTLINGEYTYWAYEHEYYNPNNTNPVLPTVATAVYNMLTVGINSTPDAQVAKSSMHVSRGGDGGGISSN